VAVPSPLVSERCRVRVHSGNISPRRKVAGISHRRVKRGGATLQTVISRNLDPDICRCKSDCHMGLSGLCSICCCITRRVVEAAFPACPACGFEIYVAVGDTRLHRLFSNERGEVELSEMIEGMRRRGFLTDSRITNLRISRKSARDWKGLGLFIHRPAVIQALNLTVRIRDLRTCRVGSVDSVPRHV
jgi:hypothetical protein